MPLPDSLNVALKEWAIVCRALGEGRQIFLLRKGGIHDAGGVFALEHSRFLLFPTYLHQNAGMLKPSQHARLEIRAHEPETVTLSAAAEVTDVVQVRERARIDAIDEHHIWSAAQIDMRFNYKPDQPLFVVFLRTYQLQSPVTIANTAEFAGCRSWVPLDRPIEISGARAVIGDLDYSVQSNDICGRMKA